MFEKTVIRLFNLYTFASLKPNILSFLSVSVSPCLSLFSLSLSFISLSLSLSRTHTHTHIHTFSLYTYMYICGFVCVCVRARVCLCVCGSVNLAVNRYLVPKIGRIIKVACSDLALTSVIHFCMSY